MRQDVIDKMLQDKLEEARQNGIAEGQEFALFEVAKNMFMNGFDLEIVSKITGLSIADIKQILD